MKEIVILDGYCVNPGDLSWDGIAAQGNLTVYDYTPKEKTVERAKHAEIVLTNKTVLSEEILFELPKAEYIGLLSTGTDAVDTRCAAARGITVTNVPAYSTEPVAQTVFSLLLEVCCHAGDHSESVHRGDWASTPHFCYWRTPLVELAGKTMGIFGMGRIGSRVAQIAQAFGMNVIAYSRHEKEIDGVTWVSKRELFSASDVLSLHCPMAEDTYHLICAETLSWMKPTAILINTSRGNVVDEAALANALNRELLFGAGVDVLSREPAAAGNPLLSAKNCVITPHIGWASKAARERLMQIVTANLAGYLCGTPQNIV